MKCQKFTSGKRSIEILDKSQYSVIEFAKLINLTRDGAYKVLDKQYIDTDQLNKISQVLKHDFFKYFSNDLSIAKEPKEPVGYATKDDVSKLFHLVEKVSKRLDEIEDRLPAKKASKTKYKPRGPGKSKE